ncbi:MAG: polysaccharide biosynthesis/export family protein, partial [Planctomycetota bacterium]
MTRKGIFGIAAICLLIGISGCYNDALDPTQLGRFEPTPTVNVILDTLGVADEPSPTYEGAEEPRPEDLLPYEPDYVFSSGDVIRITIFELYNEGLNYENQFVVSESGRISIPDVGIVKAEGLTETELEREIASILSPNIIKEPSVTATLLNSERRIFSIVGQGVANSARFQMPRYPIRLTDAIALAGGIGDFNVSYVYVSRDVLSKDFQSMDTPSFEDAAPADPGQPNLEDQMLEMITPSHHALGGDRLFTTAEMATRNELEALAAPEGIDPVDILDDAANQTGIEYSAPAASRVEWVFEGGQWKAVQVESEPSVPTGMQPELLQPEQFAADPKSDESQIPSDFGLSDMGQGDSVTRVISIPVDKLLSGDPRYNIVIRPADRITVPRDLVGEFYVTGNVNAPNAYSITGRPITLMQAITVAGGLNALAWPQKVEVRRRIGENTAGLMQEEIVLVDLAKIAQGIQPDFFIKQHDLINVGTHGTFCETPFVRHTASDLCMTATLPLMILAATLLTVHSKAHDANNMNQNLSSETDHAA